MGIASDITRLQGAKTDIAAAIEAKGVTVPEGTKMDGFATLIEDIVKHVPVIKKSGVALETSSTTISTPITGLTVGNILVIAILSRSAITNVTGGMTLLTQSPVIDTGTYWQINSIYYKVIESATESVVFTQASAGRMYETFIEFATNVVPTADANMSIRGTGHYNEITYTKPLNKCYVIAASTVFWNTTSPYILWTGSPPLFKAVQWGISNQGRLLVLVDDEEIHAQQLIGSVDGSSTNDYNVIMCGVYF